MNSCRTCGQKLSLPDSIKQGLCTYHGGTTWNQFNNGSGDKK